MLGAMTDVLMAAAGDHPVVRDALDRFVAERGDVYADPAAFERFVDGGGNVALYRDVDSALRDLYGCVRPRRFVDVGCGDGRLTTTVLGTGVEHVDLVEPSAELLHKAVARLEDLGSGPGPTVAAHQVTAEQLVAEPGDAGPWDVAQSTFALHAVEPDARRRVLAALAGRVGHLVVVEFDIPAFEDRSPEHAAYAVERYAAGIAEYDGDELVVQGFLMPVLFGQFDPGQPRHTWEQPVAAWAADLRATGFRTVHHHQVHDYWWAPAHLLEATA
jgi:hypothetical protein